MNETEAFIDAYVAERRRPFSRSQIEECWAAGLWNRSFDAKKQFATEGRGRSLSENEARERLKRAGATEG